MTGIIALEEKRRERSVNTRRTSLALYFTNLRRWADDLEVRLFYFIQAVTPSVPCVSQTVEEYQLQGDRMSDEKLYELAWAWDSYY